MRKITKRSAAITAATVIAIGGGAAAWAATNGWDITGTGTGDASAASITPLKATADLGSTVVYPSLQTSVVTSISNPNQFPVKLTGGNVTPTDVVASNSTDSAACQSALRSATTPMLVAILPSGAVIPKGSTGTGVTTSVSVSPAFPQSCAGAHIKVSYSFTAVSTA